MKVCTYTVKTDKGFAPNPFYGYCTLAACTPNHMNAKLNEGDYIVGFFTDHEEPYLLYWMRVDAVLDFDTYYRGQKYKRKKPQLNGTWISRCGDNIYYRDEHGNWNQTPTVYHKGNMALEKDTRHAIVYIGKKFSYHGENAYVHENRLPKRARSLFKGGRGIKYIHETSPGFHVFLSWFNSMPLGRQGNPRDREKRNSCLKKEELFVFPRT